MDKHNFQAVTTEQVQTLSKLKETLALSAHILVRNPGQLASQMTGRLIGDTTTPVQSLLACALQKNGPWLRPVTACLEKPGDARYRTFSGHTSVVTSLAVSADSKLVFSASADRTIRVWDINLGSEIAILQGFPCSVESLALTPEGDRILAGLFDGSIRVIRWRTASTIARLEGHSKAVTAISCTPDGYTAVSSSQDSTLVIWDLEKFKQLAILKGHK